MGGNEILDITESDLRFTAQATGYVYANGRSGVGLAKERKRLPNYLGYHRFVAETRSKAPEAPSRWIANGMIQKHAPSYPLSTAITDMATKQKVNHSSLQLLHLILATGYYLKSAQSGAALDRGCRKIRLKKVNIEKFISIGGKTNSTRVLKAAKDLEAVSVTLNATGTNSRSAVPAKLFDAVDYSRYEVDFTLSKDVAQVLYNPDIWVRIPLDFIAKVDSVHALSAMPYLLARGKLKDGSTEEEGRKFQIQATTEDLAAIMRVNPPNPARVKSTVDALMEQLKAAYPEKDGPRIVAKGKPQKVAGGAFLKLLVTPPTVNSEFQKVGPDVFKMLQLKSTPETHIRAQSFVGLLQEMGLQVTTGAASRVTNAWLYYLFRSDIEETGVTKEAIQDLFDEFRLTTLEAGNLTVCPQAEENNMIHFQRRLNAPKPDPKGDFTPISTIEARMVYEESKAAMAPKEADHGKVEHPRDPSGMEIIYTSVEPCEFPEMIEKLRRDPRDHSVLLDAVSTREFYGDQEHVLNILEIMGITMDQIPFISTDEIAAQYAIGRWPEFRD